MTDEQIWLLKYGRGWVPWDELMDDSIGDPEEYSLYTRLLGTGQMELKTQFDRNTFQVRLREMN